MSFVVAHFRKVKTAAGMGNVAIHNSRGNVLEDTGGWKDGNPPEWLRHPERIEHNEGHAGKRDDSIRRLWHRAVASAELDRKPQRNAAAAVEATFSASPDAFKEFSDWKEYLKDCREWADQKFGHDNVLQWNTHFDEKTPHLHMIFIPIVRSGERQKYSSSQFLGGREGLRKAQEEFWEKVGKKYGLDRGREGSNARHTDQAEFAAKLARKENLLNERETKLKEQENTVKEVAAELKKAYDGMSPAEVKELKNKVPLRDNRTPAELLEIASHCKLYASYIESKGCKNYGEYCKVKQEEQARKQQQRGYSR